VWWTFQEKYNERIDLGICHVRPPLANPDGGFARWPKTMNIAWCGAYYPRPQSAHEVAEFENYRQRGAP